MSLISPFEIADHYAMHCWGRAACKGPEQDAISAGLKSMAGLGAWYEYIPLWPSEREADPCAPSPVWCDYTPGAQYLKECMPIDPEYCQKTGFGPALTPESRQEALDKGTDLQRAYLELLKREDPEKAQAYEDSEKRRKCMESGVSVFWCDYGNYVMWGSFGILAFMMLNKR